MPRTIAYVQQEHLPGKKESLGQTRPSGVRTLTDAVLRSGRGFSDSTQLTKE